MRQALFIDRDGTINKDDGYNPKLELYDDIIPFFQKIKTLNIPVFVITNQSGIAEKRFTHRDVQKFNDWLSIIVGFPLKYYYCPHKREDKCSCRKPEPGLIYQAAVENEVNIGYSFMIGDSPRDIEAARTAGMFNYMVKREKIFSPSTQAYLLACHIYPQTLEEIYEEIEELVYLQRNEDKHCRVVSYKERF